WRTYTPKKGESVEAIAKRFGVPAARLREVNGITPRNRATPALLVVPLNGAADAGRLPIMYAPPIPVATRRTISHTVKPGETLATIASRYRVSVDELKRWNAIGRLKTGQTLKIQTGSATPRGKPRPRILKVKPRPKTHKKLGSKST
ncbi:MAG: LysM domain-containing protein, partial [Betaproteobacteria bacterium]